jgi:hypothetical protein
MPLIKREGLYKFKLYQPLHALSSGEEDHKEVSNSEDLYRVNAREEVGQPSNTKQNTVAIESISLKNIIFQKLVNKYTDDLAEQ